MENLVKSNSNYLVQEDLETFLSKLENYIIEKRKEGLLDFQMKDLIFEKNNFIKEELNKYSQIELRVEEVYFYETMSYDILFNNDLGEWDLLRGEEGIGDLYTYNKEIREYLPKKLHNVYHIVFEKMSLNLNISSNKEKLNHSLSIPEIQFRKVVNELPIGIKKGSRLLFNINIVNNTNSRYRIKNKSPIYNLKYIDKNIGEVFVLKQVSNTKNCFIVTTTMGDINHPVVVDFRRYRDEVLLNTYFGRVFINIYYKVGPVLSKVIKTNSFIFTISKKLILFFHNKIK